MLSDWKSFARKSNPRCVAFFRYRFQARRTNRSREKWKKPFLSDLFFNGFFQTKFKKRRENGKNSVTRAFFVRFRISQRHMKATGPAVISLYHVEVRRTDRNGAIAGAVAGKKRAKSRKYTKMRFFDRNFARIAIILRFSDPSRDAHTNRYQTRPVYRYRIGRKTGFSKFFSSPTESAKSALRPEFWSDLGKTFCIACHSSSFCF